MRNIKYYRGKAGLSQKELAEKVGIDRHYLSILEGQNDNKVARRFGHKIAEVLNVSFFAIAGESAFRYMPETDEDIEIIMDLLYDKLSDEGKNEFKKRFITD